MLVRELPVAVTLKAIDIYLAHAYPAEPPSPVRAKVETLRALPPEAFYESPAFERHSQTTPAKLSLRLGNKLYPHMKLTIERAPDHTAFLFRADTHDSHCCPAPGSREHGSFCELMNLNQKIAQAIETAWAADHLPTFKTFLRDDLARRKAGTAG
jgi:hypothetical protein